MLPRYVIYRKMIWKGKNITGTTEFAHILSLSSHQFPQLPKELPKWLFVLAKYTLCLI